MQVELKAIQRDVGITFVFVTHDQGEALSMSTRVAVFNNGRIEQVGTPVGRLRAPDDELRRRLRRDRQPRRRRPQSAQLFGSAVGALRCDPSGSSSPTATAGARRRDRSRTCSTSAPSCGCGSPSTSAAGSSPRCRATSASIAGDRVGLSWPTDAVRPVADTGDVGDSGDGHDEVPRRRQRPRAGADRRDPMTQRQRGMTMRMSRIGDGGDRRARR